jgi:hypothetical protein
MTATLDLAAVRRFTDDLNEQVRRCENGEGTICSDRDASIHHYVRLCANLHDYIGQWAHAVFSGRLEFDPEVDSLLNAEARRLLRRAKRVAARGRVMDGECFELKALDALHYHIVHFDYLLENWVKPRIAVSPGPRTQLSQPAAEEIAQRIASLPPMPKDWRPSDPDQLVFFQKQREELVP